MIDKSFKSISRFNGSGELCNQAMQRNGGGSRVVLDTLPPPSADGGRSYDMVT